MRADSRKINRDRMYEVVGFHKHNPWKSDIKRYNLLGIIIQPTHDKSSWTIRQANKYGYPSGRTVYLGLRMDLRPLNNKDQRKIYNAST